MKLGILKAGRPPSSAIPQFGTYPDMFKRLLGEDAYDYSVFAVDEGELLIQMKGTPLRICTALVRNW